MSDTHVNATGSRAGKRILLGVGAGIAAYKAIELVRLFTKAGHEVRVVPTRDALRFVGEPTWAALSRQPVTTEVWSDVDQVAHVQLGQRADLIVIAPATANLIAKAAHGIADDLLTTSLLTSRCPLLFAPAMHAEMWTHPATRANVATLRERGAIVVDPANGSLTNEDSGPGRLPDPQELFQVARRLLNDGTAATDLTGRHVVISAGGTRELLDPLRFIGNRSSGRQGYALARTAIARGARVTLVAANVELPAPAGASVLQVSSTEELRKAVLAATEGSGPTAAEPADAVVMAAAVADFHPDYQDRKIKKSDGMPPPVNLHLNPDILAELGTRRLPGQVIVGFAAETHDLMAGAAAKLTRKGCDFLVANRVGPNLTYGSPDNEGFLLSQDGSRIDIPLGSKEDLSDVVWDMVVKRFAELSARTATSPE
ncbi:bifunctional phosphopantothenoylcysteine decarboxylase/phosphopantothenate--cysteine ligase CoaBC [Streptomyces sp. MUSC 14]|uniref:bifunctional phosphopantothenoylcysteine decarboxylase/phosphopantothenate--cysteine ligase CoaBC n=1 Tax=Streptomyces sp. MUSC 14 TaxID=1354889 RepID=UPI000A673EAF|nr:bifunctional phosphopantothenoylcysteine decarboxylase/phosphopantothenate--cysteine ligase CoaBC [Streptomyces sp. MUSC 14]